MSGAGIETWSLIANWLIAPKAPSRAKGTPFECGMLPIGRASGFVHNRYYVFALLFIIFDVEAVFLFPWAIRYKSLGWFGVTEMVVFLAILIVGYIWAYKKGALEWV